MQGARMLASYVSYLYFQTRLTNSKVFLRLAVSLMNKALLLRTRHLVLDSELQCGPGSRRARSTVPSTYAAQKKLSKQNATSLRQESRFTYYESLNIL